MNLISIVFANDSTSLLSKPTRMRVPPPAAPPRNELITTHPSASVCGSFHSKTTSGRLFSYFDKRSFIVQEFDGEYNAQERKCEAESTRSGI